MAPSVACEERRIISMRIKETKLDKNTQFFDEDSIQKKIWSDLLKWIEDIPLSADLTLYPLQLANSIRIISNDAVFIFDEVGCGKTISAGIMAKTFLRQNPERTNRDILVITTNTVKVNQQFEDDWEKLDKQLRPIVFNNLRKSDLDRLSKDKKWGLVIIDEAHEFSNTDTERYDKVKNDLRAEKVVFLTATPLRGGGNFNFYKELANAILERNDTYEEIDELSVTSSDMIQEQELICAKFDPKYPITRYFKDTMRYLDIHEKKERAHRVIPEIWEPRQGETREMTLARNIEEKIKVNSNSKFVIFVRFKKEASSIKEAVEKNIKLPGYVEAVFAENKHKLKSYGKDASILPTVLIMGYQIGEAGVNLPEYDHVVHWHISSDPVRLEQRYGRIDRMTSRHEKIHSCFVIPQKFDSNFNNLFAAIKYTMGELLTKLPARNVLLTEDTLVLYKNIFDNSLIKYNKELEKIRGIVIEQFSDEQLKYAMKSAGERESDDIACKELIEFIEDKGDNIAWNEEKEDVSVLRESIQNELSKQIRILEKKISKNDDGEYIDSFAAKIKDIEDKSDQIFYTTEPYNPLTLNTIDSQDWGCAKYIQNSEEYIVLQRIIKIKDAIRTVLHYAEEDVLFASELFLKIGDIHSFTNEMPTLSPELLAYKYKR